MSQDGTTDQNRLSPEAISGCDYDGDSDGGQLNKDMQDPDIKEDFYGRV